MGRGKGLMTNSDWWAKKLGQPTASPAARESIPMPPSQQPMTRYTPPAPQQPQTKAMSARQTQLCPSCNGNNYMSVANAAPRCYDCGYPLIQSGSGIGDLSGANVEGPTKAALGNDTANNFNPTQIVGRVQ